MDIQLFLQETELYGILIIRTPLQVFLMIWWSMYSEMKSKCLVPIGLNQTLF